MNCPTCGNTMTQEGDIHRLHQPYRWCVYYSCEKCGGNELKQMRNRPALVEALIQKNRVFRPVDFKDCVEAKRTIPGLTNGESVRICKDCNWQKYCEYRDYDII